MQSGQVSTSQPSDFMTTCAIYDLEKPDGRILNRTDFGGCMYKKKKKKYFAAEAATKKFIRFPGEVKSHC